MAFKAGDMVRIKDIRNRADYPDLMKMCSGQTAHILNVVRVTRMDSGDRKFYYELDADHGNGIWPEEFLEPVKSEQDEQEWIDTVLKLIAEIESKLDALKRQLWRRKHYGNS